MVEILGQNHLRRWLEGESPETAAVIAARLALRVLPELSGIEALPLAQKRYVLTLETLRATLCAAVAAATPTAAMKKISADAAKKGSEYAHLIFAADEVAFRAAKVAANLGTHEDTVHVAVRTANVAAETVGASLIWNSIRSDVAALEVNSSLGNVIRSRLWSGQVPEKPQKRWEELAGSLLQAPSTVFWVRWYDAVLSGDPQNWQMLRQIVTIHDAVWEAGPEVVAEEIAKIEATYAPNPVPKTILREQITVLIQNATITQVSGNSLAYQIEDAITTYLREAECNGLPEDLSVLEHLPAALRRLTSAVSAAKNDESRVAELELAIQAMASEIQALKDQLETLQSGPAGSPFLKAFKEQSGKSLGDWKMWGALISGSYLLLGEPAAGTTLAHITETLKSLIGKPQT